MKFGASLGFTHPTHLIEMARCADVCGWDFFASSDHVIVPERLESPYPYDPEGQPPFDLSTAWPDPWVSIGAMAAVTERLRFLTNVFILPLRHPLLVAKAVGTAALLSGDRVALGIGVGWMREEFEALGQEFANRGRRTDEAIEVLRLLWREGSVEYHGRYHDFGRVQMSPAPGAPIPIYVGGTSEVALRRATRLGDGWISVLHGFEELRDLIGRLQRYRKEYGRADQPFEVIVSCTETSDVDDYRRLQELGATGLITMPWLLYDGDPASLPDKLEGLKRFAGDVIEKMR